ncbi:P-loop containing nucleoside triphosphate hydrolase protein [Hypoxylon sp. FL1857]|nr:P-loop containing nucleoside triphosphate hydrolase protein [Hypoxylon sp. FL1857]
MTPSAAAVFTGGEVPEKNDLVIALMGTTGSGKSSFIKLCTGRDVVVGHDLKSCTQDVQTYSFKHPSHLSFRVFLVDTPGFDDTHKSDSEILRTLTAWLTATFLNGIKLSGIVFLHRINQPRLQGSARRNVKLFEDLCGDTAFRNVILVTTMWDITEKGLAEEREKQLRSKREYWGYMVDKGSEILRHDNSKESALQVIEHLIKKNSRVILNVQDEIVNGNQPLNQTTVGQGVLKVLAEQTDKFTKELKSLESDLTQALQKKDEEMAQLMRELRMENKRDLDRSERAPGYDETDA